MVAGSSHVGLFDTNVVKVNSADVYELTWS